MDKDASAKLTGIRQIVRLREMLQKWHNATLSPKGSPNGRKPSPLSPIITDCIKDSNLVSESDEESCQSPESLSDVPKGYLAVYVGSEMRRFVIPTSYLTLPVFKALLHKAEEEYGFEHKGAITFPCDIETFKYILQTVRHNINRSSDESGCPNS